MRHGRRLLLVATGLLALPAGASAAPSYVALGDSYTAGSLIPNQVGEPRDCARSDHNYPTLAAQELGFELRDASCSGAQLRHLTAPQDGLYAGGTNPPQFGALRPDTALVTLGLSANDTGIVGVPGECFRQGTTSPTGTACRDSHRGPDGDVVQARIRATAPQVAAALRAIAERAPQARVVVVGYPALVPTNGTNCYPAVPLSPDDLAYVNEGIVANNAMLAEQATRAGVEFAGTHADSVGHDICTPSSIRWFESFIPDDVAYPIHPNARGEASMARSLVAVLRRPRLGGDGLVLLPSASGLRQLGVARRVGPPARFAVTLDRPGSVRIAVQRRLAPGSYGPARATTRALGAGTTRFALRRAQLGRRPGAYRLTLTPIDGARMGTPVAVRFRLR